MVDDSWDRDAAFALSEKDGKKGRKMTFVIHHCDSAQAVRAVADELFEDVQWATGWFWDEDVRGDVMMALQEGPMPTPDRHQHPAPDEPIRWGGMMTMFSEKREEWAINKVLKFNPKDTTTKWAHEHRFELFMRASEGSE